MVKQRLIINLYKQYQSINLESFSNIKQENIYFSKKNGIYESQCESDLIQNNSHNIEIYCNTSSCDFKEFESSCLNFEEKNESNGVNDLKVWRPW